MCIRDGSRCHRRKEVICGLSGKFVERVGEKRSMKSSYDVGKVYSLRLTGEEMDCLERISGSREFLVRVVGVDVVGSDEVPDEEKFGKSGPLCLVVSVEPVSKVAEGSLDRLVSTYYL